MEENNLPNPKGAWCEFGKHFAYFDKDGAVTESSLGLCCDTCYYAELESDDFIGE
tara:strand:+ start:46 stop:210 length:165 start_codon:yes stop_codon:yes gene_type:complete